MKIVKLLATATLAVAMLLGLSGRALAEFPDKPITIVVPWPAGGAYDLAARLMAEKPPENLPVSMVVNNVTGAAGSNGVRHVAKSDPDGYTIGMMGTHAIAQSYMNRNATPLEDLEPLVFIGPEPASLAVAKDTGIENVKQYIEQLKAQPGSIINGNDSPGGFSYIAATMLENHFDVKLSKVPYQGYAPTASALVSGEVMSTTLPIPLLAEQHKAGKVKIIGVAAEERHPFAPDVPTFKEQGYDFIAEDFYMLYLPKGVPEDRREKLEKGFYALLNDEAFQKKAAELGLVIMPRDAAATRAYLEKRNQEVKAILEDANLIEG
ncbi:Bug family tripartite tricarboxylate transporter substrate binding protein [Alloalcanivorax sp. C16-2]|uniref:Bug family tripartite tricarboxylate transporter substrate binding protein n=1 Tax=Alloalcanivorax sp. C16-2 TaxID=3390052 RepID=UPI0039704EF2